MSKIKPIGTPMSKTKTTNKSKQETKSKTKPASKPKTVKAKTATKPKTPAKPKPVKHKEEVKPMSKKTPVENKGLTVVDFLKKGISEPAVSPLEKIGYENVKDPELRRAEDFVSKFTKK